MGLYKRKGSRFWWFKLTVNKRSRYLSTKTEDKLIAQQIALAAERRLRGLPREKFIAMVDAVVGDAMQEFDADKSLLVSHLPATWERFIKDEGRPLASSTHRIRRGVCFRFSKWATDKFGPSFFVDAVTPNVAWEFISSLDGTAKTKQNISGDLSAVWGSLIRRGLVKENPWKYARPSANVAEQRTGRAFNKQEVAAILKAAHGTWLETAVMMAVYTGLRQGDVLALRWENVDFEQGLIRITPSKTERHGVHVTLPLHQALRTYLQALPKDSPLVIPKASSDPSKDWRACLVKAGVKAWGNELMTFHNLRHTYATWVREAGADKGDTMLLCGHTNMATNNRYDHATTRLKEVIDRLPTI